MQIHQPFIETFLSFLFPDVCVGCRDVGMLVCEQCQSTCNVYPDTDHLNVDGIKHMHVGFVFDGVLRTAVHQLKYYGHRRIARPLAELLVERTSEFLPINIPLIPVPLHQSRSQERGFNQAEEIARFLAQHLHVPMIKDGLIRSIATEHQVGMNVQERQRNVQGAFVWNAKKKPPHRLILVDDVLTTGATMGACATALHEAGVKEVYGLALARSYKVR